MTYRTLLLVVALLLPFTRQAHADNTGSVSGKVTSATDGKPMSGTAISVFAPAPKSTADAGSLKPSKGEQKPVGTATTDKDGLYTVQNLPPGSYTIEAGNQATGFSKSQVKIIVGQIATVNFKIRPRHEPDSIDAQVASAAN